MIRALAIGNKTFVVGGGRQSFRESLTPDRLLNSQSASCALSQVRQSRLVVRENDVGHFSSGNNSSVSGSFRFLTDDSGGVGNDFVGADGDAPNHAATNPCIPS